MIYSPIIDFCAKLPLLTLVRKAESQDTIGQTACWCPFCKQERVAVGSKTMKQNAGGSHTPHFIIYDEEFGGLYSGKGAQRWACTRTRTSGYGALELYAAIHHISLEGVNLRRAVLGLLAQYGYTEEQIREQFPTEHPYTHDLRGIADQTQEEFSFLDKTDFTPQELLSIGCEVVTSKGIHHYSFGDDFSTDMLIDDFRTYALVSATLPAVNRQGKAVSEIVYGTPYSPLFITFLTPEEDCGMIWRPATDGDPWVFSNNEEHTVAKVSKWLAGDKVFTYATEHRDSSTNAFHAAIQKFEPEEHYRATTMEWIEQEDRRTGEPNGKFEQEEVGIPTEKLKAKEIIFCNTPQDAICTYYTLRRHRMVHPNNDSVQENCWHHVAFLAGKSGFVYREHGEWKKREVRFNHMQRNKMSRFADKVTILYPNTRKALREVYQICQRYHDIALAQLPDTFRKPYFRKQQYIFCHQPSSVRDFILTYVMGAESYKYDDDLGTRFYDVVKNAIDTNPIERQEKRNKNNVLKEVYYTVNSAKLWKFMATEGFFRAVDPLSSNTIGEYIIRQGNFIRSIDERSVVKETFQRLKDYASIISTDSRTTELMIIGIDRSTKEINLNTITSLPETELNYHFASLKHSYFFFLNTAVLVTADNIQCVSYEDIDIDVPYEKVRPFNFKIPQINMPRIIDNPEVDERKAFIKARKEEKDENGNPRYNTRETSQMEREFREWCKLHQYVIEWPTERESELDPAIRLIRCFANKNWEIEEDRMRYGKSLNHEEQLDLNARFLNFLFSIGTTCWGFHGTMANVFPYIMENTVRDERHATGGSGKSAIVNTFIAAARNVLAVDCKKWERPGDDKFSLAEYKVHVHDVVHIEDLPNKWSLKFIYNWITSGVTKERKHEDQEKYGISDSPCFIVSSNYPPSDTDDSTLGRMCRTPISDRFCRENDDKGIAARLITDVMPDYASTGIQDIPNRTQIRMAYFCMFATQFVINHPYPCNAPNKDTLYRQIVNDTSQAFVDWAEWYFANDGIYGHVEDLASCFMTYMRDFECPSRELENKFSLSKFYANCQAYCQNNGILMNPDHLFRTGSKAAKAKRLKWFKLTMWCKQEFFTWRQNRGWENHMYVGPKYCRVRESQKNTGVIFFRTGKDHVFADYEELKAHQVQYMSADDPMPETDESDNPVTWNEMEDFYRQNQNPHAVPPAEILERWKAGQTITMEEPSEEDMPF